MTYLQPAPTVTGSRPSARDLGGGGRRRADRARPARSRRAGRSRAAAEPAGLDLIAARRRRRRRRSGCAGSRARAAGFIYLVSLTGITGERTELPPELVRHRARPPQRHDQADLRRLRHPHPAQVAAVGAHADGAIVGSRHRAAGRERSPSDPRAASTKVGDFIALRSRPPARRRARGRRSTRGRPGGLRAPGRWHGCSARGPAAAEGHHRRGPVGQVRVLQGDRLPRRGRARGPRLPQVRLPLPHLARASASTSLLDDGSFEEREAGLRSQDPLGFKDTRALHRPAQGRRAARPAARRRWSPASARIGGHPVVVARLRVRVHGRQHGLGGGREDHARHRAGHRSKRIPLLIVSRLGRRADAGGHPLAHADGQDLGGAPAPRRGARAVLRRSSPTRPRAA